MSFADTVAAAFKQIEGILGGNTFVYDGDSYNCHVGHTPTTTILEGGGFAETQQTILAVRKEEFPDGIFPLNNEPITFNDVVYYVDSITGVEDPKCPVINIALKNSFD